MRRRQKNGEKHSEPNCDPAEGEPRGRLAATSRGITSGIARANRAFGPLMAALVIAKESSKGDEIFRAQKYWCNHRNLSLRPRFGIVSYKKTVTPMTRFTAGSSILLVIATFMGLS
jgi:hypothetical protein